MSWRGRAGPREACTAIPDQTDRCTPFSLALRRASLIPFSFLTRRAHRASRLASPRLPKAKHSLQEQQSDPPATTAAEACSLTRSVRALSCGAWHCCSEHRSFLHNHGAQHFISHDTTLASQRPFDLAFGAPGSEAGRGSRSPVQKLHPAHTPRRSVPARYEYISLLRSVL